MNKREIIERLKNIAGHARHTVGEKPFIMSLDDGIAVYEAIELLKKPETNCSEIPNNWIPCSERLPENGRQVLVFARSVHFALAKYDEMREADGTYKMQWVTFDAWKPFYKIKDVIAWMPLPEYYQEKDGEQE